MNETKQLTQSRWQFLRTSLRNQLAGITLLMALIPVLVVSIFIGILTISRIRATLQANTLSQLEQVRTIKSEQLTTYFAERAGDATVISQSQETLNALTSLGDGFNEIGSSAVRSLYLGKPELAEAGDDSTYTTSHRQVSEYLSSIVSSYGYYDIFLIDREGQVVYTYAKEDEFGTNLISGDYVDTNLAKVVQTALALQQGQTIQSDFKFYAPSGNEPAAFIAAPIYDAGQVVGVIAFQLPLARITAIMQERTGLGNTGETYLIGADHLFRSESRFDTDTLLRTKVDSEAANSALSGNSGSALITDYRGIPVFSAWQPVKVGGLQWAFIAEIDQNEALATANQLTTFIIISILAAGLIVVVLALLVAFRVSRSFVQPILELRDFATSIASGSLDKEIASNREDELGVLAQTFNTMVKQLRDFIDAVQRGAQSIKLAAEVGRSVSQVGALDVMLKDAAEIIRSRYDLYYVQVYLADASQTNLLLLSGTGKVGEQLVGRGHRLPLNTGSINGRAATEKKAVVIADTTASATFRPNSLLPDTRSEMAVPLIVGEKVMGVLDLQSEQANALNQEILPAIEALAGQLAIAIQNANLLAETEQARAEVEAQARRLVRANWADYQDAIHKPEETSFVFEQNKISAMAQDEAIKENSLVSAISITGESLGNLVVEMEGQAPGARTAELVDTIARQVAQQIESLRLLETAERYRVEAEEASRRLTREGWKTYVENAEESLSYFYDLNEVKPYTGNGNDESAVGLPLKLRDEVFGKLAIQGLDANDSQALELVNAVAERLSAHIESLRQFDETKRGQIELDKRAQQLSSVAEISTASSKELDIQKMLESVVNLTQRKFGLYHAHVFTYNEYTDELQITACGWHEGSENEGTHETISIPLSREQSLVARAARTKQAVIVNDVKSEDGFLPNPLLPDTASEMAVPLIIGDQVLGVLDVQSDQINAFTAEDANIQTTLASQVATALQNARSFARAQQQAARESTLNVISQKIQSATSVEAVLQIAARELGHALGAPMTVAQLSMKDKS